MTQLQIKPITLDETVAAAFQQLATERKTTPEILVKEFVEQLVRRESISPRVSEAVRQTLDDLLLSKRELLRRLAS